MDLVPLITQAISQAKYPVILLMFFIDGQTTNIVASGIASGGNLNIWVIWGLSIVMELIVDLFYYFLGNRLSTKQISSKVKKEPNEFIKTLDKAYTRKPGVTLMVVKLLGPLAIPGILYMGKTKTLNVWNFLKYAFIVAATKNSIISFLGYTIGMGMGKLLKIYDIFQVLGIILGIGLIAFIVYKAYQKDIEKLTANIFKKIS